jgi:hypothetical protein
MMRDYSEYLIRDQDGETRQPLDLLHGWRSAGRESLRSRLGRGLVALGRALQGGKSIRQPRSSFPAQCGIR